MGKSATSVKADTALRDVVLAGPGSGRAGGDRLAVFGVIAPRQVLRDAVEATDCPPERRCPLSFQVTAMIILGLCLFCDQATAPVLTRLWSLLCGLDPYLIMHPTLTTPAVSKARARLPCAVMRAIFEAGTRSRGGELMLFGRAAVAADGTVLDLAEGGDNHTEFATPTGGRFPQARLVTLAWCGTRRRSVRAPAPGQVRVSR